MSDAPVSLVPIDNDRRAMWQEGAEFLRELADRLEAGEIPDVVVVWNDLAEKGFASFGHFEDRWRLMGAIEYAKSGLA